MQPAPGHPLHTQLCVLLGARAPIVQTGMGWVATPELVAAACEAGAFGFLAAAALPTSEVARRIEKTRALTARPFGVNFLMDAPGAAEVAQLIIDAGCRAASYNRAPNPSLIEKLKAAGVLCVPVCGAPRHVARACELGADAVIVQGAEGGGHTGAIPTLIQLAACAEVARVPLIAAGGFRDGRGLVAALALGASGIAMGTRFLMTAESPVPRATFERYRAATLGDIIVTREIDGLPQRVIENELVRELERARPLARWLFAAKNALAFRRASGASLRALLRSALALRRDEKLSRAQLLMAANAPVLARRAMTEGDPVRGYLPSGSVAAVLDDRPRCAELVARIVREAEATLRTLELPRTQNAGTADASAHAQI